MAAFDLTLEPKVATVRRLEVLSGDLGRRRWPEEVKARLARTGRLAPPESVRFVPVVAEAGPGRAAPGPDSPARTGVIEIELGGAIVRVGAGVDDAQLARVLRVLRAAG